MNTAHTSAGGNEPQHQGPPGRHTSLPPLTPETCKLAVKGACLVSDLCQIKNGGSHPPFSAYAFSRRTLRRGEALYRAGDALLNLYQLYAGSVKLRITNLSGIEQIVSFPTTGALLGIDGIETGTYTCDAIALEDSVVCMIPFSELASSSCNDAKMALRLNRAIAHEASHYRHLLMTLACLNSEERVASFLMDISEKMAANGYSPRQFVLKMTREDIAHHLGMKLETVSRIFTRLQTAHVLDVRRRHLNIRDPDALRKIGAGQ